MRDRLVERLRQAFIDTKAMLVRTHAKVDPRSFLLDGDDAANGGGHAPLFYR